MKQIGVGLIGTGFMGKSHALAWNCGEAGVRRRARRRASSISARRTRIWRARKAAEFGFDKASGDWRKVVADPDVDVVSITTPNKFHLEMASAALAAGKHVWCEKPMAPNLADAEKMLAAARASGKVAMLGYNYIQNPVDPAHQRSCSTRARSAPVNHVRIEMDEDFMADPEAPFQQRHEAANGYGALDDFGVHPLSLVLTLFGGVEPRHVRHGQALSDAQDAAKASARSRCSTSPRSCCGSTNGASGFIAVSRTAWGRKGRIAIQIFGVEGLDPVRPGADERIPALPHRRPADRSRASAPC